MPETWYKPENQVRSVLKKMCGGIGIVLFCLAIASTNNPDPEYVGFGDVLGGVALMISALFFFVLGSTFKS